MQIQRVLNLTAPDGSRIPAILVAPSPPCAAVVLAHPTGGCKEQMVGFALRLAEARVATLAMDLAGHGESDASLGTRVIDEVNAGIELLKRDFEAVGCLGVGSGGRIALSSTADFVVAIDPPAAGIIKAHHQRFDTPFDIATDDSADPADSVLAQLPCVARSERPCLLVVPEDELASHFIVRELEPLLTRAEARFVTTVSSLLERRLPREWRLMQNDAVVGTACQWLSQAADHARREEQVHV